MSVVADFLPEGQCPCCMGARCTLLAGGVDGTEPVVGACFVCEATGRVRSQVVIRCDSVEDFGSVLVAIIEGEYE